MTNLPDSLAEPRVLVCVSSATDAAVIEELLASERAHPLRCKTFRDFTEKKVAEADAVLISEEMLDEDSLDQFAEKLNRQPAWSDLPVVLVCDQGPESVIAQKAMEAITGLLLLNRPVRLASLGSALRMALRTRRRQYRLRDLLLERKQRERELRETNRELNEYTYALRHNVKAPFRAIQNYTNFLLEDLADTLGGEPRQFLDGIKKAVGQAHQQFSDLDALYRIRKHEVDFEQVNMTHFLAGIASTFPTTSDRQLAISDEWPVLRTEPFMLRQILMSLIDNGFKYNRSETKRVEIGWRRTVESFEVIVRDNGIGIDPQYHNHIFYIFKRLHTEEEYDGTGIGLAIARKAVKKIGGELRIESAAGQGSTFVISLPAAMVASASEQR